MQYCTRMIRRQGPGWLRFGHAMITIIQVLNQKPKEVTWPDSHSQEMASREFLSVDAKAYVVSIIPPCILTWSLKLFLNWIYAPVIIIYDAKRKNFSKTKAGRNGLDLDSTSSVSNTAVSIGVVADTDKSEFSRCEWPQSELVVPQGQGISFPSLPHSELNQKKSKAVGLHQRTLDF